VVIINGQELLYHRISKQSSGEVLDGPRPNGLGMSRAAILDRESCRADSSLQNASDRGAAKRRRLHARVGRQS
jgi:hypothetical protein